MEFRSFERRQVQVNEIETGVRYMPVIPYYGKGVGSQAPAAHTVTRIQNGTIICFMGTVSENWCFSLADNPSIQFLVPSSFESYLWKFKIKPIRKLR